MEYQLNIASRKYLVKLSGSKYEHDNYLPTIVSSINFYTHIAQFIIAKISHWRFFNKY